MLGVLSGLMGGSGGPRYRPSLDLNYQATAALKGIETFTRAGTAWAFNSSGVLTSYGVNVPRFDYDTVTLVCKGLLMEESRTNILLNSTTLSTQTVTVTAVAYTLSFYGTGSIVRSGVSSGTLTGTGTNTRVSVTFTPTAGSLVLTVSGSVKYAQLEVGSFATSPILTTGSTATRAADLLSIPTSSIPAFNTSAGTMMVEIGSPSNTSGMGAIMSGTGSADIRLSLLGPSSGRFQVRDTAGTTQAVMTTAYTGDPVKIGGSWGSNSFNSAVNSVVGTRDTSGTVPTVTTLNLGSTGGSSWIDGYLRRVIYYNRTLTTDAVGRLTK